MRKTKTQKAKKEKRCYQKSPKEKKETTASASASASALAACFADNEVHVICGGKYILHNTNSCLYLFYIYLLTVCALWSHSTMRCPRYKNVAKSVFFFFFWPFCGLSKFGLSFFGFSCRVSFALFFEFCWTHFYLFMFSCLFLFLHFEFNGRLDMVSLSLSFLLSLSFCFLSFADLLFNASARCKCLLYNNN